MTCLLQALSMKSQYKTIKLAILVVFLEKYCNFFPTRNTDSNADLVSGFKQTALWNCQGHEACNVYIYMLYVGRSEH